MAVTTDYALNMHATKLPTINNDPSLESMGVLEIHMRQRYQLQFRSLEGFVTQLEDITPPSILLDTFKVPPCVLALPTMLECFVSAVLAGLNVLDASTCESLKPLIEKFVVDVSEAYGVKEFVAVAELVVTKTELMDEEVEKQVSSEEQELKFQEGL